MHNYAKHKEVIRSQKKEEIKTSPAIPRNIKASLVITQRQKSRFEKDENFCLGV
jgi:hypothetical protein